MCKNNAPLDLLPVQKQIAILGKYTKLSELPGRVLRYQNELNDFAQELSKEPDDWEFDKLTPYEKHNQSIAAIREEPQVKYEPSKRLASPRMYAAGKMGILSLKSAARKIICTDWFDVDLQNSQFAICSRLYRATDCLAFLKNGESIWNEILGKGHTREEKQLAKKVVYGIFFGMGILRIREIDEMSVANHPLIIELLAKREEALQRLSRKGNIRDPWDRVIEVTSERPPHKVMACMAQSCELWLLEPAIDYLYNDSTKAFRLWQHDGFTLATEPTYELIHSIDKRAEDAEFMTHLTVEKLRIKTIDEKDDNEWTKADLERLLNECIQEKSIQKYT